MLKWLTRILEDDAAPVRVQLRFREPLTIALVEEACAALGVVMDDALDDPETVVGTAAITTAAAQRFLAVVCEDPPDLRQMPADRAEAVKTYAVADFFTSACRAKQAGQASAYGQFLSEQASRRRAERA